MSGPDDRSSNTFTRSLRSTVGRESTTFGFSILVTVTFGLLQAGEGPPNRPEIFVYAVGAVLSFTILEGIMSGGFRKPMPQHVTQTLALGTSMNVVSVLAGLTAGWVTSSLLSGLLAWSVAPLLAGAAYLLVESLETALAERVLTAAGDPRADEVSG